MFRADASREIGIGHVMRSLAVAQRWQALGGKALFIVADMPASLRSVMDASQIPVISSAAAVGGSDDARLTGKVARELGADWVFADGYAFADQYQQILKACGLKLVIVDDYRHGNFYTADIILNPGLAAHPGMYGSRAPNSLLLLGPKFYPLRREFLESRRPETVAMQAKKILVTLGGGAPREKSEDIITALAATDSSIHVKAVLGVGELTGPRQAHSNVELVKNASMADLMAWADLGISAGGVTLAEMAYMGLPGIAVQTAANQYASRLFAEKHGTCLFLGDARTVSIPRFANCVAKLSHNRLLRQQMREKGRRLMDGLGSARVVDYLQKN